MSEVRSTFRLKLGDPAPGFSLPDPSGVNHALAELQGPAGLLLVFACNHCPYVIHLAKPLAELAEEMKPTGLHTVAISANDTAKYPQDGPERMKQFANESSWNFPYLYDDTQEVALAYGAACTPDFFLFNAQGLLFYTGQFDDSRPNNGHPANGKDLRNAIEHMLAGKSPPSSVCPSSGCNIKWKPGLQPDWWASGNA